MLRAKLERLWNPNCEVQGATSVTVKVRMRLRPDGGLSARPVLISRSGAAANSVLDAAAQRAVSAAGAGAPYDELPAERSTCGKTSSSPSTPSRHVHGEPRSALRPCGSRGIRAPQMKQDGAAPARDNVVGA